MTLEPLGPARYAWDSTPNPVRLGCGDPLEAAPLALLVALVAARGVLAERGRRRKEAPPGTP